MSEMKDVREAAFQQWWRASKYRQVVFPKDGWEQIARDGFNAAWNRRAALEPASKPAGGKADGYQHRFRPLPDGQWGGWLDGPAPLLRGESYEVEQRALFAAPPSPAALPSGGGVVPVAWDDPETRRRVIRLACQLWDGDYDSSCSWSEENREHYIIRAAMKFAASPEAPQASEVERERDEALNRESSAVICEAETSTRASELQREVERLRKAIDDALGRHQVTHIHAGLRAALQQEGESDGV